MKEDHVGDQGKYHALLRRVRAEYCLFVQCEGRVSGVLGEAMRWGSPGMILGAMLVRLQDGFV